LYEWREKREKIKAEGHKKKMGALRGLKKKKKKN